MKQYSGTEDIYRELVENSEEDWLLGLVAFAIVEEQRIDWMRHYERQHGYLPDHEKIKNWYQEQPPNVLIRAKGDAESTLQTYSDKVVEGLDDDHRKGVEEGLIINEIRDLKRFWPQFVVNLASGFVSTILIAFVLALLAFIVLNDTSPVELVWPDKRLKR